MTTLEEISRCPAANWQYWTDKARFCLVSARSFRSGDADFRLALSGFRKNMANRRARLYLELPAGQLDMFGEAA